MATPQQLKVSALIAQILPIDNCIRLVGDSAHGRFTMEQFLTPGVLDSRVFGSRIVDGDLVLVQGVDHECWARCRGVDRDGFYVLRPFAAAVVAGPTQDTAPAESPASRGPKKTAA